MKLNTVQSRQIPRTHEGAPAKRVGAEAQLRRSVMACLLWEDSFYESGQDIATRIAALVGEVEPHTALDIAVEARTVMKLRHAPLLIAREMARIPSHKRLVGALLPKVIQRPDELAEFLALYWKDGKTPISKQVKIGLANSFQKFDEYQFAKWNKDAAIKLRDVMFLVHPKPENGKEDLFKRLAENELQTPDTWEVVLSGGADKRETWERLLKENKLGALALLRNLRNMAQVGVDEALIFNALERMKVERVLPFRFIAAARFVPQWESKLEAAMMKCVADMEKLPGKTVLLVDVSGSMDCQMSGKSDLTRIDAACGLAILARELAEQVAVYTFSERMVRVPDRRGFALRDAIYNSQQHGGTWLGQAVSAIDRSDTYDRLIVLTDEQSHDPVPNPKGRGYMLNVAAYKNGVGYGPWSHVDGWSENVLTYIQSLEKLENE